MAKNKSDYKSVWVRIDVYGAFTLVAAIKRIKEDLQSKGYKFSILKSLMKDFYPNEKF